MDNAPGRFAFGPYQFDTGERVLRRDGALVVLPPKAIEILAVLIQSGGRVVGKEELMKLVWPDSFVEDNNLTVHIQGEHLIRLVNHPRATTLAWMPVTPVPPKSRAVRR